MSEAVMTMLYVMARWESGAPQRLQLAALELFADRGFDGVTVAEIAAAAGLTERTFFRHFGDKREELFYAQDDFQQSFMAALDTAPGGDAMAMIVAALAGAARLFPEQRRSWSRKRTKIISAHPHLQERELLKLSALAVE